MNSRMVIYEVLQLHAVVFWSGIAHVFPQSETSIFKISSVLTFSPISILPSLTWMWLRHCRSAQECTCRDPHVMTLNKNLDYLEGRKSVLASLMWHYDAEMLQWCGPLAPTIEQCRRRPVAGRWWGGDQGRWTECAPSWGLLLRAALKESVAAREPQGSGL